MTLFGNEGFWLPGYTTADEVIHAFKSQPVLLERIEKTVPWSQLTGPIQSVMFADCDICATVFISKFLPSTCTDSARHQSFGLHSVQASPCLRNPLNVSPTSDKRPNPKVSGKPFLYPRRPGLFSRVTRLGIHLYPYPCDALQEPQLRDPCWGSLTRICQAM